MRRSVEEGVTSRFVTGERVEAILKVSRYSSADGPLSDAVFKTLGNAKPRNIRSH